MRQETALTDFCRRVLQCGDLEAKLAPPRDARGAPLADAAPAAAESVPAPARSAELALRAGAGRLPKPGALADPAARAVCLARFAHHELMAVELFAWALLRWPDLPAALRSGFVRVLEDEQRHCRLYLARLAAHGSRLADHTLSDYFWKHVPAIDASPHGVCAFLAAMGLTLEQANLDFSLLYRDAFAQAGDAESARVCDAVHRDEIRHVALAHEWLLRLEGDGRSAFAAYAEAVPFPLSAARAKGRRFDAASRRRAGLDEEFIEAVRGARSSQEVAGRERTRRV